MNPSLFLFGGCRVRVPIEFRTPVLDLCFSRGFVYTDFSCLEDGSIRFSLPLASARALCADAEARGMRVEVEASFGIPALFLRLLRRPGLLLGCVLGALLLFLSGNFVWAVEVTGNETLGAEEVRQILAACDFGVGSYLPAVEVPSLENRVLISTDRLSWISINLSGTVAHVQVVERKAEDAAQNTDGTPAHLVAACDGQIEYFEILRGVRAVKVGQAVRAGDVLVSGVYESETLAPRYTRAAGRVLARTERVLEITVPYVWEEKEYASGVLRGLRLNFFNFSLNFFENSGNVGESCDIIETEKVLPTLGNRALPISLSVTTAVPYTLASRTRTEGEALTRAYEELAAALSDLSADVTLLRKDIRAEMGEDGVHLVCTLACVENIARVQEFEIGQLGE